MVKERIITMHFVPDIALGSMIHLVVLVVFLLIGFRAVSNHCSHVEKKIDRLVEKLVDGE